MKHTTWIASTLILIGIAAAPGRADELSDSLSKIPEAANAVAVINVDAMYKSPRSVREGWAKKQELADSVPMPTSVGQLVIGYHIDQGNTDDSWRLGIASLKKHVPMEALAVKEKTHVETIADHQVVPSQRNCYFIGMSPTTVAVSYPADRQQTARWLRFAKSNTKPAVSSYLQQAVTADRTSHVVVAFDLEEMVEPRRMQAWLKSTRTFQQQSPSDITEMHKVLVKLRGIRISARVYDQSIVLKVNLDFAGSPKDYGKVFKSLFGEALEDFGVALDDVKNCQAQTSGNTVTLQTNLSDDGLARIMALMLIPNSESGADDGSSTSSEPTLAASKRYFTELKQIVDDLRGKYKAANNYNQTAIWHETYAKKIEQLASANVDKDLLQAGGNVAGNLRALAASLRGVPRDVTTLESQKYYRYYTPPVTPIYMGGGRAGGFGFAIPETQYQDNFAEIRGKQENVIRQGAADRDKLWQAINEEMVAIRQKMSEKYKAEFDPLAK